MRSASPHVRFFSLFLIQRRVRRPSVRSLKVIASFSMLLFCFFVVSAQAAPQSSAQVSGISATAVSVPRFIRVSGSVKDDTGKPMVGITGVTLAVYAEQQGGAALFLETQNVQLDASGRFTVLLGATKSQGLPVDIFDSGEARWVGIEPSGQAEQPRILLVSVPYALKAADAETLGGLPVTAFVLAGAPAASDLSTASSAVPNIPQPLLNTLTPAAPCLSPGPTTSGAATTNSIALFTTPCNIESSLLMQSNNTTVQLPATGTATNLGGFSSNAL